METKNTTATAQGPSRLSQSIAPSYYDLTVEPDLSNRTFVGEEKIHLDVHEQTDRIELNSADLRIHDAILSDESGTRLIGEIHHDEALERAAIKFGGTVGTGAWELKLKYSGLINDKLRGFYASTYKAPDGTENMLATTKFEPCDARRAFPCFDEPDKKARYKVSMVIDEKLKGISNGRLLRTTTLPNGKKLLEFAPTMKLSSYLIAFRVGDFVCSKPVIVDGKEVRIWCVPGKEHLTEFALTAAKYALEFFSRWFDEPYMGDKMDLIAIPDFASGAMEEFANPAFRETALLIDLSTASFAELKRVAEVICHELAHMWFGDFVTMRWWNALWLNEAFATFLALVCLAAMKPEWRAWESFNVDRAAAMKVDGLIETRPIEFPVNLPEEARQMFDVLTYQKGCAILRMLQLFLGEEPFRAGLVNYLRKHQFANADTHELWEAIEEVSDRFSDSVNITELMNSWIFQPGYPLIEVSESKISGSVTFKQRLFRYLDSNDAPNSLWHVPIHWRATVRGADGSPEEVEKVFLLSQPEETVYIGENISNLVVNAGGHGFYRVRLSDDLKAKLLADASTMDASERFNFIGDLWASAQANQERLADYWDTVAQIIGPNGETDLNVMSVVISSFNAWRTVVDNCTCWRPAMQAIVYHSTIDLAERVLLPVYNRIGRRPVAGESPQQAQLRGKLMAALGDIKHPEVVDDCRRLFAEWKKDRAAVDANLLGAVINTIAVVGDEATYDEFLQLKAKAPTPQEENRFLMALTSFRDIKLADRTLKACLDGTIRTQDAPMVLQAMLGNTAVLGPDHDDKRPLTTLPDGSEFIHPLTVARRTWNFIKDNWDALVAKFPMQGVSRMCSGVTTLLNEDLRKDVEQFFATHKVKGGEKLVRQSIEQQKIGFQMITGQKEFQKEFFARGEARYRATQNKES